MQISPFPGDPLRAKGWELGRGGGRGLEVSRAQKATSGGEGVGQEPPPPEGAGVSAWPLDVGLAGRLGEASAPPPWPRSPPLRSLLRAGFPEQAAKGGARKRWPYGSLRLPPHLNPSCFCPSVLLSVRRPAMAARVPALRILLLLLLLLPPPPGGEPWGWGQFVPGRDRLSRCIWEGGLPHSCVPRVHPGSTGIPTVSPTPSNPEAVSQTPRT